MIKNNINSPKRFPENNTKRKTFGSSKINSYIMTRDYFIYLST